MGGLVYRPQRLPTKDVQAADVASTAFVQLRRIGQSQQSGGGNIGARRIITGDTFLSSTDSWVGANTTGIAITATLPLATEYPNMVIEVERYAGANVFTVSARGTDTIDGSATLAVTTKITLRVLTNAMWHAS